MTRRNIIFSLAVSAISIFLVLIPTGFENPVLRDAASQVKAKIISVDNNDLEHHSVVVVGTQEVTMKILQGKFKGDTVDGANVMMGQMKLDKIFKPGDKVLAVIKTNKSGEKIISARADDHYRIGVSWFLFGLFALFLVLFAGMTGFKALLSFVFTALMMWKILLPFYMKGVAPIPLALIIVSIATTVIIILISGFSKKGYVALLGSVTGIVLTSLMAVVFGYFFKVPGTVAEFSDAIMYMGFTDINLSGIFLSTIFFSAAGAVMDVAMDIAAAQNEVMEKKPDISARELMLSGFNVARPVIGTMTTTLLFAYSGSFMFVFMVFMGRGTPLITVFNTNYISAEILHTLVGSFGLVLVAPATAIIGAIIYTKSSHRELRK